MRFSDFLPYLIVMAGVTYLIRAVPFAMFKKKITNRFVRSFLYYVPFAVLSVMTVPDIFFATDMLVSAIAALVVAVILAYREKGLLTVALFSCGAVFVTEQLVGLINKF